MLGERHPPTLPWRTAAAHARDDAARGKETVLGAPLDIDLSGPAADADPHSLLHELRSRGAVHWSGTHRAWVAVTHEAVLDGFRAPWLSSDRVPAFERIATRRDPRFARVVELLRGWMVFRDPPAHTRLRDPMRRVFTPRRLAAVEPVIARITDELLDHVDPAGFDVRQSLARPLPALVIADMLGVPREDREAFQRWSDELAHVVFAAEARGADASVAIDAAERFFEYFGELIARRRARPGDDLVSALVASADDGGPTAAELVGACTLLLFAGHETTAGLIANGASVLLDHPGELARLRSAPELWPLAVDELLRLEGPAKLMVRKATVSRGWHGAEVGAGDTVFLVILAADRDPAVFADPDRVDIARDPNPHLGFGWGLHHCLGATLARLEGRIALRRLFERMPRLERDEPARWGGGVLGRTVLSVRARAR